MANDPAFLFYPGDWLGGTITFTRAQKGAYMDLLIAQFNQVALTLSDIKLILGNDFWMWDAKLSSKFKEEPNGLYFNPRLRQEIIRRKLFNESRKPGAYARAYAKHMHVLMENENENENEIAVKKQPKFIFSPPTVEDVKAYCQNRKNGVDAQRWHDFYTAKGWMVGKNKMRDWKAAVRTWERDGVKPSEHTRNDRRDLWERNATKTCINCRGTGAIYAPGSGQYAKCGCVKI